MTLSPLIAGKGGRASVSGTRDQELALEPSLRVLSALMRDFSREALAVLLRRSSENDQSGPS